MKIRINVNSWHYRLGYKFYADFKPMSICGYFWSIVWALVVLPPITVVVILGGTLLFTFIIGSLIIMGSLGPAMIFFSYIVMRTSLEGGFLLLGIGTGITYLLLAFIAKSFDPVGNIAGEGMVDIAMINIRAGKNKVCPMIQLIGHISNEH